MHAFLLFLLNSTGISVSMPKDRWSNWCRIRSRCAREWRSNQWYFGKSTGRAIGMDWPRRGVISHWWKGCCENSIFRIAWSSFRWHIVGRSWGHQNIQSRGTMLPANRCCKFIAKRPLAQPKDITTKFTANIRTKSSKHGLHEEYERFARIERNHFVKRK